MDKKIIFFLFEVELLNEAKRIVPLVYNEKELSKLVGEDWENDKFDIEKSIEHHYKVLEYDKKEFGANVEETIDLVAKDIVDNYDKWTYVKF